MPPQPPKREAKVYESQKSIEKQEVSVDLNPIYSFPKNASMKLKGSVHMNQNIRNMILGQSVERPSKITDFESQ